MTFLYMLVSRSASPQDQELQKLYDEILGYDKIRYTADGEEDDDGWAFLEDEADKNSNTLFSRPHVVRDAEVVRLSKNKPLTVDELNGHSNTKDIGLTFGYRRKEPTEKGSGYSFAFPVEYYENNEEECKTKYGKFELRFKVREALEVEHVNDEEIQVIFNIKDIIK